MNRTAALQRSADSNVPEHDQIRPESGPADVLPTAQQTATRAASVDQRAATSEGPEPSAVQMPVRSLTLWIIAVLLSILVLRFAQDVVIPVVIAVLISYALDPLVNWFERRRLPRFAATVLVLMLVVGGVGATVYSLRYQAIAIIDDLPRSAQKLREELRVHGRRQEGTLQKVQDAASAIEKTAAEAAPVTVAPRGVTRVQIEEPTFKASDYLWWGSMGIVTASAQTGMVLFLAFFLLLSGDRYKRKLVKIAGPALSDKKLTIQILNEITGRIERFLLAQVFTSVLVAVVTGLALWRLGVDQAGVWGSAAGLFNSIPYFGPVIVSAGLAVVAYMQFGNISMATTVASVAMLITTLEGWLLTPALMGKAAQMSPAAIFVSLLFWSWMWGIWGLILAVPLMMAIKAICDNVEDLQWIGELLGE